MNGEPGIAYFSMEIAVENEMRTYAGGLGVLAGDTLRAAADESMPIVGVTLIHRKGYLRQRLDETGWQHSEPDEWPVEKFLTELPGRVALELEGRTVHLRAWQYEIIGVGGHRVPVLFLDADLPENSTWDRALTHYLYGGDAYYRLCQEAILGVGGIRMLRALGYEHIARYHMNEGHSSLLTLELLIESARRGGRRTIAQADINAVRASCIFTTHTPVAAAHDQFPMDLIGRVLGANHDFFAPQQETGPLFDELLQLPPGSEVLASGNIFRRELILNLTHLALSLSHYVNGVAKRHAEVSQRLFVKYRIDEITNGVHAAKWVAPALHALYDRHIPGWEVDNFSLRYSFNIPVDQLWAAHLEAKHALLAEIRARKGTTLSPDTFTIGFARRFTAYKRGDLLLTDFARLQAIAARVGPLQIIYSGKAHPQDQGGKEIIQRIVRLAGESMDGVRIVFLPNYDIALAQLLVAGCDLWLNTPLPPMEASGTSGMKAALNGVPSLSILDGWWLEGCVENVTGWAIEGKDAGAAPPFSADANSLYEKLEHTICPCFYERRAQYTEVMRHTIALNGSFFNTQRMIQQYAVKAYL